MRKLNTEPAVIVSLISAIVALAVSFGANLSGDQVGAIMAVVVIVAGLVTRTQVTPAAKADAAVNEAVSNVYQEFEAG